MWPWEKYFLFCCPCNVTDHSLVQEPVPFGLVVHLSWQNIYSEWHVRSCADIEGRKITNMQTIQPVFLECHNLIFFIPRCKVSFDRYWRVGWFCVHHVIFRQKSSDIFFLPYVNAVSTACYFPSDKHVKLADQFNLYCWVKHSFKPFNEATVVWSERQIVDDPNQINECFSLVLQVLEVKPFVLVRIPESLTYYFYVYYTIHMYPACFRPYINILSQITNPSLASIPELLGLASSRWSFRHLYFHISRQYLHLFLPLWGLGQLILQ